MIEAKIILDSVNDFEDRLTTWALKYPRFIHAEVMTHRMFSRNAASSRAMPIDVLIDEVLANPAMPEYWGSSAKTMQAGPELNSEDREKAKRAWLKGRDGAVEIAKELRDAGVHQQIANRPLETYSHMLLLVSATDYENFFAQRAHQNAQPEIQKLAYMMLDLYNAGSPTHISAGKWHLPFADLYADGLDLCRKQEVSVARAARTSYKQFDKTVDVEKDFALFKRLYEGGHWSPFEHVAKSMTAEDREKLFLMTLSGKVPGVCGNFKGWIQYRKHWKNENRKDERVKK